MNNSILEQLRNNKDFVVALSSTVDTLNVIVRKKFIEANNLDETKINDYDYLTKEATRILREDIIPDFIKKGYLAIDSVGYWEGREQPNSFLITMPEEEAKYYVEFANELLAQDSIIAFGPGCNIEILDNPADYCTKVEDKWIRYDFAGVVLESRQLNKKLIKEHKLSEGFTLEHLVDIVYKVAGNIYYRKEWPESMYSKEDFIQEAAIYIVDKWNEGYFEGKDHTNIVPAVIGMLNGWFLRNKHQQSMTSSAYRKTKEHNIQGIDELKDGDSPTDKFSRKVARELTSPEDSPEEHEDRSSSTAAGNLVLIEVLKEFSKEPYPTRKHNYQAFVNELGTVKLSPWVIARMLTLGYTDRDIIKLFTGINADSDVHFTADSRSSYVYKRVREVYNSLISKFRELSEEDYYHLSVAIAGKIKKTSTF